MHDVLVVGSVALDSVKTPFGDVRDALGGSASYFSVAARHFVPVSLVAIVGEDFPTAHIAFLEDRGVDLSGLVVAPGRTFRWAGEYGFDLQSRKTLDTQLNVFADFDPVLTPAQRRSKYVFLANIHPELQTRVLDQVEEPQMVVMDTMNFWVEKAKPALLATIRRVDVLLLNDEETRMLGEEPNLVRAARAVLAMGPSVLIVKKGEHGAFVLSREFMFTAPAYPIELVYDPTGAGDTFAGGFLGYLAGLGDSWEEADLRRAAIYGTVLASFTVEAFSLNRLATATREEIDARFREIRHMAHF
jgi:sugar/nucleoside kinase (ribokinase family)